MIPYAPYGLAQVAMNSYGNGINKYGWYNVD